MHTIRTKSGEWFVQFVENSFESGYTCQRWDVAKCRTANLAGNVASWLNGGEHPGVYSEADVEFLGGH